MTWSSAWLSEARKLGISPTPLHMQSIVGWLKNRYRPGRKSIQSSNSCFGWRKIMWLGIFERI
jgi:hypothetical protein